LFIAFVLFDDFINDETSRSFKYENMRLILGFYAIKNVFRNENRQSNLKAELKKARLD
jgi:hypothetical protein